MGRCCCGSCGGGGSGGRVGGVASRQVGAQLLRVGVRGHRGLRRLQGLPKRTSTTLRRVGRPVNTHKQNWATEQSRTEEKQQNRIGRNQQLHNWSDCVDTWLTPRSYSPQNCGEDKFSFSNDYSSPTTSRFLLNPRVHPHPSPGFAYVHIALD